MAGSQHLYGEEQLRNVARDAEAVVKALNESGRLPYKVVCKGVMTTAEGITQFMKDVNYQDQVAGVITWMHTFSPAKNWIRGTKLLQIQLTGVVSVVLYTAVALFILFKILDHTLGLRVPEEDEISGLDISEHNLSSSYADFLPAPEHFTRSSLSA